MIFFLFKKIQDFTKKEFTKTKGWASPLISELSSKSNCTKSRVHKTDNKVKVNFFKRTAAPPVLVKKSSERSTVVENYPTLLLQSEELILPDTRRDININSLVEKDNKRVELDKEPSLHPCRKKRKLTVLENNNVDDELLITGVEDLQNSSCSLLESYLKYL